MEGIRTGETSKDARKNDDKRQESMLTTLKPAEVILERCQSFLMERGSVLECPPHILVERKGKIYF